MIHHAIRSPFTGPICNWYFNLLFFNNIWIVQPQPDLAGVKMRFAPFLLCSEFFKCVAVVIAHFISVSLNIYSSATIVNSIISYSRRPRFQEHTLITELLKEHILVLLGMWVYAWERGLRHTRQLNYCFVCTCVRVCVRVCVCVFVRKKEKDWEIERLRETSICVCMCVHACVCVRERQINTHDTPITQSIYCYVWVRDRERQRKREREREEGRDREKYKCVYVCVCVCVCVRERPMTHPSRHWSSTLMHVCVCVCVCMREKEMCAHHAVDLLLCVCVRVCVCVCVCVCMCVCVCVQVCVK